MFYMVSAQWRSEWGQSEALKAIPEKKYLLSSRKKLRKMPGLPLKSNRIIIELLLTPLPKHSIFYVTIKKQ